MHRAGDGSPRVRMEAGREAERSNTTTETHCQSGYRPANLRTVRGCGKTFLRKENRGTGECIVPPAGRHRSPETYDDLKT